MNKLKKKRIISIVGSWLLTFNVFSQSPYIYKVFEYRPAPGQFVNELPEYEAGDTPAEMALKAEECIKGTEQILVTLGGYGGYIVFGFDHLVKNIPREYDFKILGNAFYANANPNPNVPREGGSSEPGIVMVSYDTNGNGKPDDEWYELAGSEYHKPETIKNYQLTYYKPDENKMPTPDPSYPFLNDTTYIVWKSNQGEQGYLCRNIFHNQSYYPQWINDETLTFEGTKLADNSVDESGNGSYYVQYSYAWGYADNHPNTEERSNFNIEWAVDSQGNPVNLQGIHFVKVYTGVNQYCGWQGETSTEIMGAEDLHFLEGSGIPQTKLEDVKLTVFPNPVGDLLNIITQKQVTVIIYNTMGAVMKTVELKGGTNIIDVSSFSKGVYILKTDNVNYKITKK